MFCPLFLAEAHHNISCFNTFRFALRGGFPSAKAVGKDLPQGLGRDLAFSLPGQVFLASPHGIASATPVLPPKRQKGCQANGRQPGRQGFTPATDNVNCPSIHTNVPPAVSMFCLFPRKENDGLKSAFNRFGFFLIVV
jgi:hypothetical protein